MRLKQTMDPEICDKLRSMINLTENFQAPIDGIDGLLGTSTPSSFREYSTVALCVCSYLCDWVYCVLVCVLLLSLSFSSVSVCVIHAFLSCD